jgi:hypothetical protein
MVNVAFPPVMRNELQKQSKRHRVSQTGIIIVGTKRILNELAAREPAIEILEMEGKPCD